MTATLCRECCRFEDASWRRCPGCGSMRTVSHSELFSLGVAHIDCDAFYAAVEKRDRPELADLPVIVGGGVRGVVSTACYVARLRGVRSAMPMFKALASCPDAVVIRPDFRKYTAVARELRVMMGRLTPLVQPLSIDEAAMDLAGTETLHGAPAAVVLARFARDVERELGITVSIGLAANRLLAKLAAEEDKPRGFAVFGAEAPARLASWPVRRLPGVGPALERRLAARGLVTLGQLQVLSAVEATRRLGDEGPGLAARARGEDVRAVRVEREAKSISAETTFDVDLSEVAALEGALWRLCEKLGSRLREASLAAGGVVLKLKTKDFASRTRAARLAMPTMLPDRLFESARGLLAREADGASFRLIGVGASSLLPGEEADHGDLADTRTPRLKAAQAAIDTLRARFGAETVMRGRGLNPRPPRDGG